jgi:altronate dehydratase small subunit
MTYKRGLILHPKDNVASVLDEVFPGETVEAKRGNDVTLVEALERIPFGFKLAVTEIAPGDPIIKYGEMIGQASQAIQRGALVHIHNLAGARGRGDLRKYA